ncbi:MAG: saccharopine dehydrogenase NADP-binding domain-containing protein [Holophagales bacterium]|nr:saccharopine dehydrogenase NADP-binding domain-containing protein [Holophagales bacterium]
MSAAKKRLLLYGANGYTGRLILDAALARGLSVTVAGRRPEAVESLANERGVPFEVFPLDEAPRRLAERFSGFGAVLLAAGPFSKTSSPVLAACLKSRVSYLDITGRSASSRRSLRGTPRR